MLVHVVYDIWHHRFRKPLFSSVYTQMRSRRFQKSPLLERFDNIVFNARKGRLPIRVDGRNEEKNLRFQKYLDMCKQGLNQLSKNKEQY